MGAIIEETPSNCHNCCSVNIELLTPTKYNIQRGNVKNYWHCLDCGATCGCHLGTNIPLGKMADKETRTLRHNAHLIFDQLWKQGYKTRTQAYNWLAAQLHIGTNESHISWLTKEQLSKTIEICSDYLQNNRKALERRKLKKYAKQIRRSCKTASRINRRKRDKSYRYGGPRRN